MKQIILKLVIFAILYCVLAGSAVTVTAQITPNPPSTSLPTSADGGGIGSGSLNFQPDLFTGRFTYTVPISVPPGRGSSQPKLALNYNSSVGNGWCGVGWQLEVGKIERETRFGVPITWTNASPTNYDDSKSFTISFGGVSGHLVDVSSPGHSPVQYRLQVDKAFLNFFYYNNVSNAYWTMTDKNGEQFFFGESPSNRLDNGAFTNRYGSETFRWALDRIVDANGNETFITYTNVSDANSSGTEMYPLRISYNANINSSSLATNTIDFVLTNRTDTNSSLVSGIFLEHKKLLSQIIIKANGQMVRRYALSYATSPSTYRSLLTSVTEYASDNVSTLPPITFNYQVEQFGFGPIQSWGGVYSEGKTNAGWNSIMAAANGNAYVSFVDVNGDGLPDRVMQLANGPYSGFIVQRNTGTNFVGNYFWGGLTNSGNGFVTAVANGITTGDLFDINGDGRPDYVKANTSSNWIVQLNTGSPGSNAFSPPILWGGLASGYPDIHKESVITPGDTIQAAEEMIDLNADGLPDRHFGNLMQLNTGSGFSSVKINTIASATKYYSEASNFAIDSGAIWSACDINGDGLPDYVTDNGSQYLEATLNNGTPNENSIVYWSPLQGDWNGYPTDPFIGINFELSQIQDVELIDINGDGLPDRVMTRGGEYYTFEVQINNGSSFSQLLYWTNVLSQTPLAQAWNSVGYISAANNSSNTVVALMDINGDGLPDRIMCPTNAPYTNWLVQLNLGPFPDLMCAASNGLGGSVQVTYTPSTRYDNTDRTWTNDPWAEGAKSLLPFPVYTVSSIAINDGFGNIATNTYAYQHGYFDHASREFRGFGNVTVTDPYGGKTVTYFHQGGGFNNATNGEFQDQGSFSKKGMPYRVETWGTNGALYQIVLNKINEYVLSTNGWYFPCVTQTVVMNYEGLSTYRASAVQYTYDTNTENLIAEADLGEVVNVTFNGQTFTPVGSSPVFKWITYTNIGNILNRPMDTKITSDSGGVNRLRETINTYDGNGNPKTSQSWLNTAGIFITTVSNSYDQYGNLAQTKDAAGITTTITYDSTFEQFPASETVGSFTSYSSFDNRSGQLFSSTDIKGLVSSNSYDAFFRPTASYISTNANGPPVLWQTKMSYSLAGISNGISYNYTESQVNNAVDPVNGFVTYTFADGRGRTVETRDESETSGQYRVANTVYDMRGNPFFGTLPYFSPGTNYTALNANYLGSLMTFDSIGRAYQSTPAVTGTFSSGILTSNTVTGGDSGSPVGPTTTAFVDGSNPWATIVTDANGKITKSYRDAFGRTVTNTQVTASGNINTVYVYDLLGNLTNTLDNAGNPTKMTYDSLGRKTSMIDPDMGTWTYAYDNDNRLTQQIDARNNTIQFNYSSSDPLGRLTSKQIYNSANALVGTTTYQYDSSGGDPNYSVYPGQLYKVTDLQGYERFSYDVRGRTLKDARFLSVNAMEYTTQAAYDDADRIQQVIYPGGVAIIQYSYDAAGHLSQVKSTAGTATNEVFYTPQNFNALDQLTGCTYGNGVGTTYSYYGNSTRLRNITSATTGTSYQNLTYQYDNCSDVTSVNDGVNPSGVASGTITGIAYDDLYRVTSVNSAARGAKTYGYNSIGNLLTNQDFGSGTYQYGAQPHMVASANGTNYFYDACGNMTTRGNQTLTYDAQNQLIRVTTTNDSVAFGYDDSGERLWRAGTNGYTVWIGGIYEINNGKVLCHVVAGGQLIATFEPECNAGLAKVFGQKNWYAASTTATSVVSWPFKNGRGRWTLFGGAWVAILGICMLGARGMRLKRYEWRRALCFNSLWRQGITLASISAMLWAGTGRVEASASYTPVFYFYCTDYLGSSNVLTDNSGNLVQHYEYSTFGQTSYQNNTSAFPVSNRYTGQTADDETGLMYYGGRYYDPQLGRFIQPDPTIPSPTDSQSFNRYSYCSNNPMNEIDPSGFDGTDIGGNASNGDLSFDNNFYYYFGPNGFTTGFWNNSPNAFNWNEANQFLNQGICNQPQTFDSLGNAFDGFNGIPNESINHPWTTIPGVPPWGSLPTINNPFPGSQPPDAFPPPGFGIVPGWVIDQYEDEQHGIFQLKEPSTLAILSAGLPGLGELKLAKEGLELTEEAADVLTADAAKVAKGGPVHAGELTTYQDFVDRSVVGDNMEGHEIWQHANVNEQGLATTRLSTPASQLNPVIVLDKDTHAAVNAAQRVLDARAMTPVQNIKANAQILRDLNAAPASVINAGEKATLNHAANYGF
jgi:RHS repeat-associated protein